MTPDQKIDRIKKALDLGRNTFTWEDVEERIVDGRLQIFDNDHGVWITEITQTPQRRFLNCWIVAGELPGVMALQANVEAHAKANGCEFISATARPGWKHVAKEYGWEQDAISIVKVMQ